MKKASLTLNEAVNSANFHDLLKWKKLETGENPGVGFGFETKMGARCYEPIPKKENW